MPTKQETFDLVVDKLLEQNARATAKLPDGELTVCCFRSSDGRRCALGWLLTDEDIELLAKRQSQLSAATSLLKSRGYDISLLHRLRAVHDLEEVSRWASSFRDVAQLLELSTAAVDRVCHQHEKESS